MQTRQQIIDQTLHEHEATTGGPDEYSPIIRAELEKRLTEPTYFTCADFEHFDINCCTAACESEPHYEMIDVILDDGRHVWVCCFIRNILIRRTRKPRSPDPAPDGEERARLLGDIFGWKSEPIEDELHAANMAATSDEEKLYYCLKYAHHKSGRTRGDESVESIVQRARSLPGGRPGLGCNEADPPQGCGLCLQCGAAIYVENLIPGTSFHNCKRVRELRRNNREDESTGERI